MKKWFSRLADVPMLGYPGHPTINRTSLDNYDVVAKRHVFRHWEDDSRQESLMWKYAEEEQSSSPASKHWHRFEDTDYWREERVDKVLQRVFEALELPATPDDYSSILEGVCSHLWGLRKTEPRVLKFVDQFARLTLRLAEIYPNMHDDRDFTTPLRGVEVLIEMNLREGRLDDALSLAERALRATPANPESQYRDVHAEYSEKVASIQERRDQVRLYGV